jgi:hypothetical protein
MELLRLILAFGLGYSLGNVTGIVVRVRRRGAWDEHDCAEVICWSLVAFAGLIPLATSYLL